MNPQLLNFVDHAQVDGVLAIFGALPRILLARAAELKLAIGWLGKCSVLVGSLSLGIAVAFVARQFPETEKWAPIAALAAGFCAQDLVMTAIRRSRARIRQLEGRLDDGPPSTLSVKPPPKFCQHRYDHEPDSQ